MRKSYICLKCGETGLYEKTPCYCPYCGSSDFKKNDLEARRHAQEIVDEMKLLAPEVEKAWEAYVNVYVEFENKRRVLDTYMRRGLVEKDDVPKIEKRKLIDALYEYRARRKDNG